MAYIDETFAVLPLGCSCQANKQILENMTVIAEALAAPRHSLISTYFDWLIAPSRSIEKLIADDLPVPETMDEIGWSRGRPEYIGYGSLFYHEFLDKKGEMDKSDAAFEKLKAKFTHTATQLKYAATKRSPIFIWQNTQNNLKNHINECDGLDIILTQDVMDRIVAAGDRLSGQAARYVFVTYQNRQSLQGIVHERAKLHILEQDSSTWIGDTQQWAKVFAALKAPA